jgi:hypothetical protein
VRARFLVGFDGRDRRGRRKYRVIDAKTDKAVRGGRRLSLEKARGMAIELQDREWASAEGTPSEETPT